MATKKEIAGTAKYVRQLLGELLAQTDLTEHEEIANELVASVTLLAEEVAENRGAN
jgi:hypothetical protein